MEYLKYKKKKKKKLQTFTWMHVKTLIKNLSLIFWRLVVWKWWCHHNARRTMMRFSYLITSKMLFNVKQHVLAVKVGKFHWKVVYIAVLLCLCHVTIDYVVANLLFVGAMKSNRLSARWSYPPPHLGNFADIPYLKEQSFLHRIRDVCTLQVGA